MLTQSEIDSKSERIYKYIKDYYNEYGGQQAYFKSINRKLYSKDKDDIGVLVPGFVLNEIHKILGEKE